MARLLETKRGMITDWLRGEAASSFRFIGCWGCILKREGDSTLAIHDGVIALNQQIPGICGSAEIKIGSGTIFLRAFASHMASLDHIY